jgi:hypothetical protein
MQKIQVILDEKKIRDERLYSLTKIEKAVDSVFVDRYGLVKGSDGFYLESGNKDDYVDFLNAILLLKDQGWFMSSLKTWLWFNSDDSSDPEDFAVEDIRAHYDGKVQKSA